MKKRAATKTKPSAPKVKKVILPQFVVAQIEAPAGHIPLVVPGPHPHVVKIVPVPAEKAQTWTEWFFGPDRHK